MAAQGPQQPRGLHIFLASFYFLVFYDRVGLHSSTTEGCPGMRARVCVVCYCCFCFYLDFVSRVLGRAGFRTGQVGQMPRGLYNQGAPHISCHILLFGILG